MTTREYLRILKALGLPRASQRTAAALGVTLRTVQRFNAGGYIPGPIERLLHMYDKHGLPKEYQEQDE